MRQPIQIRSGKFFTSNCVEELIEFLRELNADRAKGLRLPRVKHKAKTEFKTDSTLMCKTCGEVKPLTSDFFYYDDHSKCIECRKEYRRKREKERWKW